MIALRRAPTTGAPPSLADALTFQAHRPALLALAYRMLGDMGRAEDTVQEAWLRWHGCDPEPDSPRAWLVTVVTRLCLNELDSARARREEMRGDRLPEPVDLEEGGIGRLEALEQVSMAFLVVLQRLSAAERAVLLLHEVLDFSHDEIAAIVGRTPASCRKLLERARQSVAAGRKLAATSREEHERLLRAFLSAAVAGDVPALVDLLARDAALITDGGANGSANGRVRNLAKPLIGAPQVAAFVVAAAAARPLEIEPRTLNGQPAVVLYAGRSPVAALLLAVVDGSVQRVFFHADSTRLGHLGRRRPDGATHRLP